MCDSCSNQPTNNYLPYNFGNLSQTVNCEQSNCSTITDSQCVTYSGVDFNCISNTSKSLESILQSIDTLVCDSASGTPWSTFNYSCLEGISTAQSFAETISSYVCNLSDTVTSNYNELSTLIDNINLSGVGAYIPAISGCTYSGVTDTDSLTEILVKFNNVLCDLDSRFDISEVPFDQCFTVLSTPITIADAFSELIEQICQVKASVPPLVTLPTFDNTETCLPLPGATDSLTATISKIIAKLCSLPSFDATSLTPYSCVPAGENLFDTIENIRAKVTVLVSETITEVGSGLTLTDLAAPEACQGKRLSLDPLAFPDEKVKATSADSTSGYLVDKLTAGYNITIDDTVTPDTLTLIAANDSVKVSSLDPNGSYLIDKLVIDSLPQLTFSITENDVIDPSSHKLQITPNINWYSLIEKILLTIKDNTSLTSLFCDIDCGSVSSCFAPSNFSVEWSAPDFRIGYGVIGTPTNINVYYRKKGDSVWLTTNVSPANPQPPTASSISTGVIVTSLLPLTIYEFKASTVCMDSPEVDSDIIESFGTLPITPVVTPGHKQLTFDFGVEPDISTLTLILKDSTGTIVGSAVVPGSAMSVTILALGAYTTYYPTYYYNYIINGVNTSSPIYTLPSTTTI